MQRILIVEDEPSIAETLIYTLQTEHFETEHCVTGEEALQRLRDQNFCFAILDVGLPDMSGFDLCKDIRQFSNVPILFLTARDAEIDRILGLELGGDDYVTKPFSPREVATRVRAILRRTENKPLVDCVPNDSESSLHLLHDEKRCVILCRNKDLQLTANEYKLLLALLEQPGRVYSREQLLEKAWEDPGSAMDRTVDSHIKSLRAKMRSCDPGTEEMIQTRRGLGYVLVHLKDL